MAAELENRLMRKPFRKTELAAGSEQPNGMPPRATRNNDRNYVRPRGLADRAARAGDRLAGFLAAIFRAAGFFTAAAVFFADAFFAGAFFIVFPAAAFFPRAAMRPTVPLEW